MKKAFEILDNYLTGEPELTDGQYHHIKLAMEEYAKEVALEFGKFLYFDTKERVKDWIKGLDTPVPNNYWELFQDTKNKNNPTQ